MTFPTPASLRLISEKHYPDYHKSLCLHDERLRLTRVFGMLARNMAKTGEDSIKLPEREYEYYDRNTADMIKLFFESKGFNADVLAEVGWANFYVRVSW